MRHHRQRCAQACWAPVCPGRSGWKSWGPGISELHKWSWSAGAVAGVAGDHVNRAAVEQEVDAASLVWANKTCLAVGSRGLSLNHVDHARGFMCLTLPLSPHGVATVPYLCAAHQAALWTELDRGPGGSSVQVAAVPAGQASAPRQHDAHHRWI